MFNKRNIALLGGLILVIASGLYFYPTLSNHPNKSSHPHEEEMDHHDHDSEEQPAHTETEEETDHHDHDSEEKSAHTESEHDQEGRTEITEESAQAAGITTLRAGPITIKELVYLNGNIALVPNQTVQLKARFPGIVREVNKSLGDSIKVGDILATIESNDSLESYALKSPVEGVVLARNTNAGDVVEDEPLFVVSDLGHVFATFHVFHRDLERVKVGTAVEVFCIEDSRQSKGKIQSFLPVADSESQTLLAQVKLENSGRHWQVGMAVTGKAVIATHAVPLAVKTAAIQRLGNFNVVFAKKNTTYEVRNLELGVSDGEWTQVKAGLSRGETYVSTNSFLVKADIEKSGATHEH